MNTNRLMYLSFLLGIMLVSSSYASPDLSLVNTSSPAVSAFGYRSDHAQSAKKHDKDDDDDDDDDKKKKDDDDDRDCHPTCNPPPPPKKEEPKIPIKRREE